MFFICHGKTVILLLTLTQSLVFATSDNVKKKTEPPAELIVELVNVPLLDGLDWVSDPSESYRSKEVIAFIHGVESREVWAQKMLQALLKIERKIPKVHIRDIRSHKKLMANALRSHNNVRNNRCGMISLGKKYLIDSLDDTVSSSSCYPTSKNESEVVQMVNDNVKDESLSSKLDLEVNFKNLTMTEIFTLTLLLAVSALMIFCTICDIVRRRSGHGSSSTTMNTLSKFSLYTNALAVLSTKVTDDSIPAIHGIRCLSCISVVIGHRYLLTTNMFEHKITLLDFMEFKNSWVGTYVTATTYAVDTFMVLSGFFTTCRFFKAMNSRVKSSWPIMYLRRYFRLTPCVVVLMLFATIFSHRTRGGTLWRDAMAGSTELCHQSWWVYLLYAQNIIKDTFVCLPHTWYLAVDMQLFWISPVILYPLYRWPKFGLRVLTSCFLASIVTPAIILATNGYHNALMRVDMSSSDMVLNFANFYIPAYNRASPYLVGIFLGYYAAKKRMRLTMINVTINWLATGTVILLCIWSSDRAYNTSFAYNLNMESAFAALSRASWSIGIAWIIYACTQGYGGLVTKFLSLPLFFPLSRLAYCIYLVHPGIQIISLSSSRAPSNYLELAMFYEVCSDLVLSIAAAFAFSLFVEAPVITLAKILMSHDSRPEQAPVLQETQKTEATKPKTAMINSVQLLDNK